MVGNGVFLIRQVSETITFDLLSSTQLLGSHRIFHIFEYHICIPLRRRLSVTANLQNLRGCRLTPAMIYSYRIPRSDESV